jgi:hypothetical protein
MPVRCPACYSERVVEGRIGHSGEQLVFELPAQAEGFWCTGSPTINVEPQGFVCLDCGMVWTRVDKREAEKAITRGGSDELLERLRIAAPPKRKWFWRFFGRR